ncbi:LCP family protein [Halobacillus yeomjeoni]|uniref:LCP family glycopolymer transferase n=1 Tax=Halobacillus yeomjeoni TaxID=311194 RepID=UPI001CD46C3E|nr:LCP family protein [Halobacillus yeomjeoni]MCA0985129.1 LCP family protein [Halobacillus yeomjeoni]
MSRLRNLKKRRKKRWTIVLFLLFLSVAGGTIFALSLYSEAEETVNKKMYREVSSIDHQLTKKKVKSHEPLSILLLGVDERSGDRGRSDAIMVLTLDPEEERSFLVSIPRDTRTLMVGDGYQAGSEDKINHAYAFGGPEMAIDTVEAFLDIELDYYMKVNMEGLASIVDVLGGITVHNTMDWVDNDGYHFEKGLISLGGEQALEYARMRYYDPNGDLGRNDRQRQVIKAIVEKATDVGALSKAQAVMEALSENLTTNIEFSEMKDLIFHYQSAQKQLSTYQMTGTSTTVGGIYYLNVPDQEVEWVKQKISDYSS